MGKLSRHTNHHTHVSSTDWFGSKEQLLGVLYRTNPACPPARNIYIFTHAFVFHLLQKRRTHLNWILGWLRNWTINLRRNWRWPGRQSCRLSSSCLFHQSVCQSFSILSPCLPASLQVYLAGVLIMQLRVAPLLRIIWVSLGRSQRKKKKEEEYRLRNKDF